MNIGIITNLVKDKDQLITKQVINWLEQRNISVYFDERVSAELALIKENYCDEYIFKHSDIIIVLGGDGTLLNVARQASCNGVPLFGINMGHLGFLTETEVGDMFNSLEKLISGEYTIEKRLMLEAFIENDDELTKNFIALNDIVVAKGNFSRLISYSIYINNSFVDLYSGDGIIVCSPTGSTAYSLSAGGPIVSPDVEVLLVTPVCPHTLHSRSILVSNKDLVRIEICKNNNMEIIMTVDGQNGVKIKPGDVVIVKQSKYYANLVKLNNRSFFDVLRGKMSERRDIIK
ncbi:MAG: NAD(+) kinase [Clostridiales bacterium GWB2_37_7]|nr:MAG: NAD(+) kinase [Clostridiales bacterium GWB2_37_7]